MGNRISERWVAKLGRPAVSQKVSLSVGQRAGLTLAGGAVGVLSVLGAATNASAGSGSIQNTSAPPSNSVTGFDKHPGTLGWNGGSTVVIEQNQSSPASVPIVPRPNVILTQEVAPFEVQDTTPQPEAVPPVEVAPQTAEPAPASAAEVAPAPVPQKLEKPPVTWVPSPNFDERPNGRDIDAIVLHHTASNNTEGDLDYFTSAEAGVAPHYLIGTDGTIFQLVADEARAFHAGESELNGEPSVNNRSIGIEITNDGTGQTPFTEQEYQALEQLVPWLVQEYDIPIENVVGHKQVAPSRKVDPAENFDTARIMKAIADKVPA